MPDETVDFEPGLLETVEFLDKHGIPFRLDPILEPIGCGFAASLGRYLKTRAMFPEVSMLRDPSRASYSAATIELLASNIKDNNYRILIDEMQIHLISAGIHIRGTDPFVMMDELMLLPASRNVDASHAFYLGFELAKALTALTLGKRYEQDESLRWGMHTRTEKHHRLARKSMSRKQQE